MVKKSSVSRRERRIKHKKEQANHVKKQRAAFRKRQRNKRIFNYTILGLIIIAVISAIYTVAGGDEGGQHDDFARCLTQKGAIMYGTDWCPHCQDQKRLFGKSFKFVNYINCDLNDEACQLAGVSSYPTWVFTDGETASGVQLLSALEARTGCTDAP